MSAEATTWPRVQELLDNIMARWERKEGRKGLPGIHSYSWATPQELANDESMGTKFIEPGLPAEETRADYLPEKGVRLHPAYADGRPVPEAGRN